MRTDGKYLWGTTVGFSTGLPSKASGGKTEDNIEKVSWLVSSLLTQDTDLNWWTTYHSLIDFNLSTSTLYMSITQSI
jgi:hypothetical protein